MDQVSSRRFQTFLRHLMHIYAKKKLWCESYCNLFEVVMHDCFTEGAAFVDFTLSTSSVEALDTLPWLQRQWWRKAVSW